MSSNANQHQALDAQYVVDELNKMLHMDHKAIQSIATTWHPVSDSFAHSDTKAVMSFVKELNQYSMGAIGLLKPNMEKTRSKMMG